MGHFRVSTYIRDDNGRVFSFHDTVYSECGWAADHPDIMFEKIIPRIGPELAKAYGTENHDEATGGS